MRPLALASLLDDVGELSDLHDGFLLAEGAAGPLSKTLLAMSQVNQYLQMTGYLPTHQVFDRRKLGLFRGSSDWESRCPPVCDQALLVSSIKDLSECQHRQAGLEIANRNSDLPILNSVLVAAREFIIHALQKREATIQATIFEHLEKCTPTALTEVGLKLPCPAALFVARTLGSTLPRQIQGQRVGDVAEVMGELSKATTRLRSFRRLAIALAEIDEGLRDSSEAVKTDLRDLKLSQSKLHDELLRTDGASPRLAELAAEYVRYLFAHELLEQVRSKPV